MPRRRPCDSSRYRDPEQNTLEQIEAVRSHPWIAKDVPVRGFVFDVETGLLHEVQPVRIAHGRLSTCALQAGATVGRDRALRRRNSRWKHRYIVVVSSPVRRCVWPESP